MTMKAFAWKFESDKTLEEILSELNAVGPWRWEARESYWYCDYLNCRPASGIRIRIHDHGQPTPAHFFQPSATDYTMQLDIDTQWRLRPNSHFIQRAKELLVKIGALNIGEIESYD